METESAADEAARLAWYHVISIQESIVPPEIFRPAQSYCWKEKPKEPTQNELTEIVQSFANDKALRDWIQKEAAPEHVFAMWEAVAELSRRFFLLDNDEKPDPNIVTRIREQPSARAVFILALQVWKQE